MAINQWDKGSKENGANAHKKGNRTNSKRETKHLTEASKAISKDIGKYKETAEKVRSKRKYKQEDLTVIYERIKDYIRQRTVTTDGDYIDKPLTVSGMILASGISKATWYEMLKGDYDYRLYEYIDLHNIDLDTITDDIDGIPYVVDDKGAVVLLIVHSEILQKAMLAIEAQTEERLYSKGRVGDIFSLKAVHGWREEASPQTVNQTLVIASEEQARKAIDMLK
jgi:hypothetical protein